MFSSSHGVRFWSRVCTVIVFVVGRFRQRETFSSSSSSFDFALLLSTQKSSTARHHVAGFSGRRRDDEPYKLGLTGSIGTGKSTVAKMLERTLGVPTYDADKVVHELYGENGSAVAPLRALFGEDVIDSKTDAVDRKRLGEKVVGHPDEMAKLEAIVHPLVEEKRKQFIEDFSKKTADVLVFDVPLLFEKRLESTVDGVLVVSCSLKTQRERVMSRTEGAKMSVEKFEKIRKMQMADEEKRKRATRVIDTEKTMEETEREIERIVEEIRSHREKRIEEVTKE